MESLQKANGNGDIIRGSSSVFSGLVLGPGNWNQKDFSWLLRSLINYYTTHKLINKFIVQLSILNILYIKIVLAIRK